MKNPALFPIFIFVLALAFSSPGCNSKLEQDNTETASPEQEAILAIHDTYVTAWLKNDEDLVMSLLEEGVRIQPSGLCSVEGKEKIRNFWFPKDSSVTTIHQFDSRILSTHMDDSLGQINHRTFLSGPTRKGLSKCPLSKGELPLPFTAASLMENGIYGDKCRRISI